MADAEPVIPLALAEFFGSLANRSLVPIESAQETRHVGDADVPWAEIGDGSAIQMLHVDLTQGLWISKVRLPGGYSVTKHLHTGIVYAVTLEGRWFYKEAPEAVNAPGSYLFEPAGSIHTLMTPAGQKGHTVAWFAIYGANIDLGQDGNIVAVTDARAALQFYRGYCNAVGLDCSKLIVIGE